jgi:hypothetical protein
LLEIAVARPIPRGFSPALVRPIPGGAGESPVEVSPMEALIVAVKRECLGSVSPNWKQSLAKIDGVRLLNGSSPNRARLEATPVAIREIERRFGHSFHIERPVEHHRLMA